MGKRDYTGFDRVAGGKRAGLEKLVDLLEREFGLWNNGTWVVRRMRNKVKMSVHSTGRAADLSWRAGKYPGTGRYEDAARLMNFLTDHAELLEVEAVFDYYPKPYGRGYKCDRDAWRKYWFRAFSGTPGGDWVHIEISNRYADDPAYYEDVVTKLLGHMPVEKNARAYPGRPLKKGSKGRYVKLVQEKVGATQDGDFGPKTEAAVKKWQRDNDLVVDGVVGPVTWGAMFETVVDDKPRYPGVALRRGSQGDAVRLVQEQVGAYIDGDFGRKTERSVKAWQKQNAACCGPSDGVVGPRTWGCMFD